MWHEVGFPFARRKLSQYQEKCGIDLDCTEPFAVQVKSGKNINLFKAIEEIDPERKKERICLVMAKKDRFGWLIALRWEEFRKLLKF